MRRKRTKKDFLSNIKTNAELATYLAAKTSDHSKGPTNKLKKCIVTSGTKTKGNICVPSSLVTHSQEEAHTLLLLHALSIDRHAEAVIASPDIDVFLLVRERERNVFICNSTSWITTIQSAKYKIQDKSNRHISYIMYKTSKCIRVYPVNELPYREGQLEEKHTSPACV